MSPDPTNPASDPNHFLHPEYLRSLKVGETQQEKYEPLKLPPGATIEIVSKARSGEVPSVYSNYEAQLTAAIDYLVKNNTGLAKVPLANLEVSPHHLRNMLREVRNFMKGKAPHNYPVENLTFTAVPDGVVVRDKTKEKESFKITTPVSKPGGLDTYPIVATPELIAALAVVLNAKHEDGNAAEWPNFVLTIPVNNLSDAEHNAVVVQMNNLMRQSFPSNWTVGDGMNSMFVELKRKG